MPHTTTTSSTPSTTTSKQPNPGELAPQLSTTPPPVTGTIEILDNGKIPSGEERQKFFKKLDEFLQKRNQQQKPADSAKNVTAKYNETNGKIELSGKLEDVKAALSEFSNTEGNQNILHVLSDQHGNVICGFQNGKPVDVAECKKRMKQEPELHSAADAKQKLEQLREKESESGAGLGPKQEEQTPGTDPKSASPLNTSP